MVERTDRAPVATFLAEPPFAPNAHVQLGEDEAHHIRVLRLGVGDVVSLRDGRGGTAIGTLVRASRSQALVEVQQVSAIEPPDAIHLLVPIADRDRMLWLAEKAAELNVTSWRPVLWRRSRSVSPRGEGSTFTARLRARMTAAMLQSKSAWLPEIFPDAPLDRAIAAAPAGATRLVLHQDGGPLLAQQINTPVVLVVGPEGGIEPDEMDQLVAGGFTPVTLGGSVLRFETAGVAGVATVRSALISSLESHV